MVLLPNIIYGQTHSEKCCGLKPTPKEELARIPLAATPRGGKLPPRVDLSPHFPPPGDQGMQQSCVGWAVAYGLKSYQEHRESREPLAIAQNQANLRTAFSPAFIYNQINQGLDAGSFLPDAFRLVMQTGAVRWAEFPYIEADYKRQPDASVRARAAPFRIDTWTKVQVTDLDALKEHLRNESPVVIAAHVDDSFKSLARGQIWSKTGPRRQGHAMVAVGYDDSRQAFKVLNSWGLGWADGGYGWIHYDLWRNVVFEGYVARDAGSATTYPARSEREVANPTPTSPNVAFQVTNIQHNVRTASGPGMQISGTLQASAGYRGAFQVVVHFFFDTNGSKGPAVAAAAPGYQSPYGTAVSAAAPLTASGTEISRTWTTVTPYSALKVTRGGTIQTRDGPRRQVARTLLFAEPILYLDNVGVSTGGVYSFYVDL